MKTHHSRPRNSRQAMLGTALILLISARLYADSATDDSQEFPPTPMTHLEYEMEHNTAQVEEKLYEARLIAADESTKKMLLAKQNEEIRETISSPQFATLASSSCKQAPIKPIEKFARIAPPAFLSAMNTAPISQQ